MQIATLENGIVTLTGVPTIVLVLWVGISLYVLYRTYNRL